MSDYKTELNKYKKMCQILLDNIGEFDKLNYQERSGFSLDVTCPICDFWGPAAYHLEDGGDHYSCPNLEEFCMVMPKRGYELLYYECSRCGCQIPGVQQEEKVYYSPEECPECGENVDLDPVFEGPPIKQNKTKIADFVEAINKDLMVVTDKLNIDVSQRK